MYRFVCCVMVRLLYVRFADLVLYCNGLFCMLLLRLLALWCYDGLFCYIIL